jgi:hypothetical protein
MEDTKATAHLAPEPITANALERFFGETGESPGHTVEEWRSQVADGYTLLGYWEWVVDRYRRDPLHPVETLAALTEDHCDEEPSITETPCDPYAEYRTDAADVGDA